MRAGTARGFRDILPSEALARERIVGAVQACLTGHGYAPVETPLLELHETFERGGRLRVPSFQLFDSDSGSLVLRSDLTMPIARLVSERTDESSLPLRLRYLEPVVRESSALAGQPRQFTQLGAELFDLRGSLPEIEIVSVLAEALKTLGVPSWRIVCGSVTPLLSLLDACAPNAAFRAQVLSLVHDSDLPGLDGLVKGVGLDGCAAHALRSLCRLAGGASVIDEADSLLAEVGIPLKGRGTCELRDFARQLSGLAEDADIGFDFSIVNSFDYYTGIVFKAYSDASSGAIASGGRYDAVPESFGRPEMSACGFALSLERLQEVLGEQGESGVVSTTRGRSTRPLRIAVPKGGLFKGAVDALDRAGLPVEGLRDLGRRLIVSAGDVEYVIVRAQDAPAFVGHGGADCGICGNDSIIEADIELVQLVDLGFGACRFVVAEPRAKKGVAEGAYSWRGAVRVATKYPRITQDYYDSIGQKVDIVTLHGNIELGPIVGMTDRIVDITATGATLRENDLVIVDDVMSCTARFFAGPAAYRSDGRVRRLAASLGEVSQEGEEL